MADGDHELQVLVAEPPLARLQRLGQRHHCVDVHHAHGIVAALHRHADRLAHARAHHAVARRKAIVVLGVAREHTFAALEHVVENRAADGHRGGVAGATIAAGLRLQLPCLGIEQHDAAAVGLDPFEHQLQDPAEQFVDVEGVAGGERRPIHHLHVATGPGEPAVLCVVGHEGRDHPLVFPHGAHDPRSIRAVGGSNDVDQADRPLVVVILRIHHHRAADLNLIAAAELGPLHLAVVDVCAVGTLQIAHHEPAFDPADLRMPPGDLVVVELHEVARLAADSDRPRVHREVVAGAAIAALDDVERRH